MGGDFLLFAILVSIGVLQLVAAWGRLGGLSFFKRRYLGYIFAAVMIAVGYWWFFRVDRNIPDYEGGLAAGQLFVYSAAGVAIAVLLSLLVASAIKARWGRSDPGEEKGLDALKRMTYLQALKRGLRRNK